MCDSLEFEKPLPRLVSFNVNCISTNATKIKYRLRFRKQIDTLKDLQRNNDFVLLQEINIH